MQETSSKKSMKALAIMAAIGTVVLTPGPAGASDATFGNIVVLIPHGTGGLFFNHTGTRTTQPACATVNRWIIDVSTPAGQTMAATLLTAYSLKKRISISGTGVCNIWPDTETVSHFTVED